MPFYFIFSGYTKFSDICLFSSECSFATGLSCLPGFLPHRLHFHWPSPTHHSASGVKNVYLHKSFSASLDFSIPWLAEWDGFIYGQRARHHVAGLINGQRADPCTSPFSSSCLGPQRNG